MKHRSLAKDLRTVTITMLPLSLTAAALWATHAAYQSYLFDALSEAKLAAFVGMVAVHLFVPIWAGTRPKWFTAALAQLGLLAVNDYFFLVLILARPHDYVEVSKCGMAGAMFFLMLVVGFIVHIPVTLVGARTLHRQLHDNT